ncbi:MULTISPECIES: N-methyl-L-tryptophan oxidase [unclassified Pseudomonas]|uniref:N-methyl-L-tryptophan oxidase n=1 Tax=unclassified Pseudomonas TaxID=196821 RepID=UPI000A1E7AD2|nr:MULTISPECIES: N-methyl-L-tryptophan oxidase [unclassified Pseudomonas]
MSDRFDVAVVGLGVMGAMATWQAAEQGAKVIAFEQFDPGHPNGASHGGSRIFRTLGAEGKHYVPLAKTSLALYQALGQKSGQPLLTLCGGLTVAPGESRLIADAMANAAAHGIPFECLTRQAMGLRFPQFSLASGDLGLYEPSAGVIRPEASVLAAIAVAVRQGARIERRSRCLDIQADRAGKPLKLITDTGTFNASKVILATGGWFNHFARKLDCPIRLQRSTLSWFKSLEDPSGYGPSSFPVFTYKSGALDGWGIPDIDGMGVKVGVSSASIEKKQWLDRPEDNKGRQPDDKELQPVSDFVAAALPGLSARPAFARPCMSAQAPDGDFILGQSDRLPGFVLCGGFAGHGFKHAPAVGLAAAQLALEGATTVPIQAFSPDRF